MFNARMKHSLATLAVAAGLLAAAAPAGAYAAGPAETVDGAPATRVMEAPTTRATETPVTRVTEELLGSWNYLLELTGRPR